MRVKNQDGSIKDVAIKEVNADNYIVPATEKHLYHVKQEIRQFDRNTGQQQTKPFIQKYGKKMFESGVSDDLKRQGYTVVILHDPNKHLAEMAEAKAARAAEMAEAKAKADAEAKAAEKAALKAEIMAELEAAGIVAPTTETEEKPGETEEKPKKK